MGHPTAGNKGDDLYVRNTTADIVNKHSQIADNGRYSNF